MDQDELIRRLKQAKIHVYCVSHAAEETYFFEGRLDNLEKFLEMLNIEEKDLDENK